MNILIKSLGLENFKGARKLDIDLNGQSADISGDNATYKTTVLDAVTWLLFGKDSQGKAKFDLKTLNPDGSAINNLNHSVTGIFLVDGKRLELKKTYKENWTKKRGSVSKEFTGHVVDYMVDSVPVKEREYQTTIKGLINEESFKLLTTPDYFNSMKWQDQRALLIEVCGDVDINDVIASNDSLKDFLAFLGDHSAEDKRKIIAGQKTLVNKKMVELPARIDELESSLVAVNGDIASLQAECRNIETAIEEATADEGRGKLRKDRQELLDKISQKETAEKHGVYDIENQIESINRESARLQAEKTELEKKAEVTRDLISTAEGHSDSLRKKWQEVDDQQVSASNQCPSCQQELPGSQVQRAIDAANVEKAEHLERINEEGKKSKSQIEVSRGGLENLASQNNDLEELIIDCTAKVDRLTMELSNCTVSGIDDLKKQVEALTEKIEQNSSQADVSPLRDDLQAKQSDIATIEAQVRTKEAIEKRRAELKTLSAEFEDLEKNTVLLEKFTETKVEMLTGKINNTFKLARFKLFERQINGGIAETCQTLFNGIPFHTGLNNGAKIQVGLDIIKTFQEHFKVNAPIFIDNAESVVSLPEMGSQLIRLVVDGSFKNLDIKLLK